MLFPNVDIFDGANEKRIMNVNGLDEGNLIKNVSTSRIAIWRAAICLLLCYCPFDPCFVHRFFDWHSFSRRRQLHLQRRLFWR